MGLGHMETGMKDHITTVTNTGNTNAHQEVCQLTNVVRCVQSNNVQKCLDMLVESG